MNDKLSAPKAPPNCLLEHHAMPLGELLSVALRGVGKASHWALAEEEAEHATDVTSTNLERPRVVQLCKINDIHM